MRRRKRRLELTAHRIWTRGQCGRSKIVPKPGWVHWLRSGRLTLKIWLKRSRLPGWVALWLRCLAASGSDSRQRPRPPAAPPE